MSRKKKLATTAGVIAIAAGGAFAAHAAIPGSDGVIHGCYAHHGQLRVIESGRSCKKTETALDWNQKGSPGSPGTQGQQGPPGEPGSAFAYAYVENGSLVLDMSKNVVSMTATSTPDIPGPLGTMPGRSLYCFVVSATPTNASVASPIYMNPAGLYGQYLAGGDVSPNNAVAVPAMPIFANIPCPAGTNAAVLGAFVSGPASTESNSFFITFN